MQNYDEPYMIKYDDKNWRPADFRNGVSDIEMVLFVSTRFPHNRRWTKELTWHPSQLPHSEKPTRWGFRWGSGPFGIDCEEADLPQISESLPAPFMACLSAEISPKNPQQKLMAYVNSNIWDGWP